jgi:CRP-like cAMP-binding protein
VVSRNCGASAGEGTVIFKVEPSRDRVLHRALMRAEGVSVRAGEVLWAARSEVGRCAHVREGLVAVRAPDGSALALAGPGELTALEGLGPAGSYRTRGEALTGAVVAWADGDLLLRRLRRGVHTLPLLIDGMHAEVSRAHRRAGRAGGGTAAERLAVVLTDLADRMSGPDGWLPVGITHQILGELAGLHRSTVTTVLADWTYHDRIEYRGRRLRVYTGRLPGGGGAGGDVGSPR